MQRADDRERLDRVVRMLALQLSEHRRDVRAIYAGQQRNDGGGGGEATLADERLGVQNLFFQRPGYVSEKHDRKPPCKRERGSMPWPKKA